MYRTELFCCCRHRVCVGLPEYPASTAGAKGEGHVSGESKIIIGLSRVFPPPLLLMVPRFPCLGEKLVKALRLTSNGNESLRDRRRCLAFGSDAAAWSY